MENLRTRIIKGINFFRNLKEGQWDSHVVKKYLPTFLTLVEKYLDKETFKKAKRIFK